MFRIPKNRNADNADRIRDTKMKNRNNRSMNIRHFILTVGAVLLLAMLIPHKAYADPTIVPGITGDSTDRINDENRSDADADLYHYMNSMMSSTNWMRPSTTGCRICSIQQYITSPTRI